MKTLLASFGLALAYLLAGCSGGSGGGATPVAPTTPPVVKPTGISLLAGSIGGPGYRDDVGVAARFSSARGSVADAAGNIYAIDAVTIRKIAPDGRVSTLAGSASATQSAANYVDGVGDAARFSGLFGIVANSKGNLLVLDGKRLRQVTPAGVVTTVFDSEANGSAVLWLAPLNLAIDRDDNAYVSDAWTGSVTKVTPAGVASVLPVALGSSPTYTCGECVTYNGPRGVALDAAGNLYATEPSFNRIRKIAPNGSATVFATVTAPGNLLMTPSGALIASSSLGLVAIDAAGSVTPLPLTAANGAAEACTAPGVATGLGLDGGGNLVISATSVVCRRAADGTVSVVAGTKLRLGSADGAGAEASFSNAQGMALDAAGNLFVADGGGIRKITPAGVTTTLAPSVKLAHYIAVDKNGDLLVTAGSAVLKITQQGVITTLAGNPNRSGDKDGVGADATFGTPSGIALDANGNAFVADRDIAPTIRKITPGGVVSTVAGGLNVPFIDVRGFAMDANGNLYIPNARELYKLTPAGILAPLTIKGADAKDAFYTEITIDSSGNLYTTDLFKHVVYKITPAGDLTIVAGTAGVAGVVLGPLPGALDNPRAIVRTPDGVLYVTSPGAVLKIELP
jgi:sugar lactone lactonase YvrE